MADNNGGDQLAWFLLGTILGAAGALLLAPQSGSETRELIRRKADEGRETLGRTSREAYDRGRDLYERGKGLADEAAKRFRSGEGAEESSAPSA